MVCLPPGRALRLALAVRVASDAADAVVSGTTLPDRAARRKVAGFAAGWAGPCALSARMPQVPPLWTGQPGGQARRAAQTLRSVRTARSSRRRMLRGPVGSRSSSKAARSSALSAGAAAPRMRCRLVWA